MLEAIDTLLAKQHGQARFLQTLPILHHEHEGGALAQRILDSPEKRQGLSVVIQRLLLLPEGGVHGNITLSLAAGQKIPPWLRQTLEIGHFTGTIYSLHLSRVGTDVPNAEQRCGFRIPVPRGMPDGQCLAVVVQRPLLLSQVPIGGPDVLEDQGFSIRRPHDTPDGQRLVVVVQRRFRLSESVVDDPYVVEDRGFPRPEPHHTPDGQRLVVVV